MEQESVILQEPTPETMTMPNLEQLETLTSTRASGTDHLDAILEEFGAVETEKAFEKKVASLMNKEEFSMLFFGAGNVCHVMLGYDTLLTLNPENPQAVEAVSALYDCIFDVPQLHWMLRPGNVWMQRAFSIGFFFVPFAIGIKNDIREKRIAKVISRKQSEIKRKDHIEIDLSAFNGVGVAA